MTKGDRHIISLTLPIILSNVTVPLLGAVDTAVVGHLDHPAYIGAVSVGALIFSYVFWGFGFLRMATTGLAAQARGQNDVQGMRAVFGRASLIALFVGALIIILQVPIIEIAIALIKPGQAVEQSVRDYFNIRIWSSPATLMQYCILGWLLAVRDSRAILIMQLALNSVNILLDITFVQGFGWDVQGVAGATVIADYFGTVLGLLMMHGHLKKLGGNWQGLHLFDRRELVKLMRINSDLFIRTMVMSTAFALFTSFSVRLGEVTLAANAVLQNFMVFASFALDGFANAAETLVGQAYGQKSRMRFLWAVRKTTVWGIFSAVALTLLFWVSGPWIVKALTSIPEVQHTANHYLFWAEVMPLSGVLCFVMDGVFFGATQTRYCRNTVIVSACSFAVLAWIASAFESNHFLWIALNAFFILRGITLLFVFPRIVPVRP